MTLTILLTSFRTWKPTQASNASDDLLHHVLTTPRTQRHNLHTLRHIPVDFQHAPVHVIGEIQAIQPDLILLCGMAASRKLLNLEERAIAGTKIRTTSLNLPQIRKGLRHTRISKNAGRFVCNGLYYAVLAHLQSQPRATPCLFVHVPVLTPDNTTAILQDFHTVLDRVVAEIHDPNPCLSIPQRDTITV